MSCSDIRTLAAACKGSSGSESAHLPRPCITKVVIENKSTRCYNQKNTLQLRDDHGLEGPGNAKLLHHAMLYCTPLISLSLITIVALFARFSAAS